MTDRDFCGAGPGCASSADSAATTCAPGQVCSAGTCRLSCQGGLVDCNGTCVDINADRRHCGACDNAVCADGFVCDGTGRCTVSCQGSLVDCQSRCIDPTSDRRFCGATPGCGADGGVSGVACPDGQICAGGTCRLSCQEGRVDCGGSCVDINTDRRHCGACHDAACADGFVCDGTGHCALSCQGNLVGCKGQCVDPAGDRRFCGATPGCGEDGGFVGVSCAEGQICSGGNCRLSCQEGLVDCNGSCVDTSTDRRHCGACDNAACADGFVCDGTGRCALSCQEGLVDCNHRCIDPESDRQHCGATNGCGSDGGSPGTPCAAGNVCANSRCVAQQGPAAPRCTSEIPIALNSSSTFASGASVDCAVSAGVGTMRWFIDAACDHLSYAACDLALGVTALNAFDADNGRAGVLEIEFCTQSDVAGELNLWYGVFPTRKKLALLTSMETMRGGTCRTVRRAPEDAVCHWTSRTEFTGDCSNQPPNPGIDLSCVACGSTCNQGCPISFPSTKLTLIAEQCTDTLGRQGVVQLKAVRFLPKDCTCSTDLDCSTSDHRPRCGTELITSKVCAPASFCGVCIPVPSCPQEGDPCTVTHAGRECEGVVHCTGQQSICELIDPTCITPDPEAGSPAD